jgi:hypothetical protein
MTTQLTTASPVIVGVAMMDASEARQIDDGPVLKRPSVPLVKWQNGHWCWKAFGRDEYVREPELEATLLDAQGAYKKAA